MRLIAACAQCKRQYDATGRQSGAKFHCQCGQIVVVPRPKSGLDATIVRCSSCGAPKQDADAACRYCSAAFTLHEKDMHTTCPSCLTRVSDTGRFCHKCGEAINPETKLGEQSLIACPACPEHPNLISREFQGKRVAMFECDQCAGMWFGHESFDIAKKKILSERANDAIQALVKTRESGLGERLEIEGFKYRKCPECKTLMNRKNYGGRSGVIIDICRHHGLWFDANELSAILLWLKNGGDQIAALADEEKRKLEAQVTKISRPWSIEDADMSNSAVKLQNTSLIAALLASLFDL